MILSFVRWPAVLAVALVAGVVRAAELPIIARARAYLGSEAALNNVRSIHYVGTVVTTTPAEPTKQTRGAIEIIVVKPDRYRMTITSEARIETTGLDGYDAWTRVTAANDPTKWQQTLLGAEGVKRLRANTWENFAYFRGLEREGGSVQDKGVVKVDGIDCQKVAFVHAHNILFYRYFDIETGRLVHTETEADWSIREQGELIVDGVRFGKTITTVVRNQMGQSERTVTIVFDKITLNENFPASFFTVPPLTPR